MGRVSGGGVTGIDASVPGTSSCASGSGASSSGQSPGSVQSGTESAVPAVLDGTTSTGKRIPSQSPPLLPKQDADLLSGRFRLALTAPQSLLAIEGPPATTPRTEGSASECSADQDQAEEATDTVMIDRAEDAAGVGRFTDEDKVAFQKACEKENLTSRVACYYGSMLRVNAHEHNGLLV